jgi:hypothetical protein
MSSAPKAPKHLLIIAIVTLLWNLVGAYDYVMTVSKNEAYLAQFTSEQLEYFTSFPMWVGFTWPIAIWGGVVGCILLLLKKHLAVPVFLVSLVSMVLTAIYNFGLSDGMEVMGTGGLMFTIVIFLVALGLLLYSRAMHKQGYLT